MVKEEGRTEKEKTLEEKVNILKKITKQTLKDRKKFFNFVSTGNSLIYIHNYNFFNFFMSFSVDCTRNNITIQKLKHYELAYKLAEAYEKHFPDEQWTLKRDYKE